MLQKNTFADAKVFFSYYASGYRERGLDNQVLLTIIRKNTISMLSNKKGQLWNHCTICL